MSGDPRDILRLNHCPRCGYDLATLPRDHRCPECGFEYDDSMFIVTGDARRPRATSGELAAYVTLTLVIVLPVAAGRPVWGRAFLVWLLAGGSVSFFGWLYRRRLRARHGGDNRVLISDDGVALLHAPWSNESQPWSRVAEVKVRRRFKFRRTWNRNWRFRLRQKRWHPLLGWDIDVVLDGTLREVALLRNEIRRRIQAARNG